MDVASICQRNVATINRFDDLTQAASLMRGRHVGFLIVTEPAIATDGPRPVGVLTDRDIVIAVVAREADPRALRVDDVMTREPLVARDSDAVGKALESMRRIGVRRLPVVDSLGRLTGVLSLDDIIDALAGDLANVAASIRNEQRIEAALRP
jgi:CBS domain-containing protein